MTPDAAPGAMASPSVALAAFPTPPGTTNRLPIPPHRMRLRILNVPSILALTADVDCPRHALNRFSAGCIILHLGHSTRREVSANGLYLQAVGRAGGARALHAGQGPCRQAGSWDD